MSNRPEGPILKIDQFLGYGQPNNLRKKVSRKALLGDDKWFLKTIPIFGIQESEKSSPEDYKKKTL